MNFSSPQFWERFKTLHTLSERAVSDRSGSYQGLLPEALYNSPADLITILSHPLVQGTFVDLGCGLGLPSLIYKSLHPQEESLGLEFEEARVEGARRLAEELNLAVTFSHEDLLLAPLPQGQTYFLYFPTGMVLDRVLSVLYHMGHSFRLVVIESHGDLIPRLIKENWLKEVAQIPLVQPRHDPVARIFERLPVSRSETLRPHELSFREEFLLISQGSEEWIGESLGLEWSGEERYELHTPPRTIQWSDVKEVLRFDELDSALQKVLLLRRKGLVSLETSDKVMTAHLRKIILRPTFQLELSSGEKVEWERILTIKEGSHPCGTSS